MIRHALTIEHCARECNERIAGSVLVECWTQDKNACVLRFLNDANVATDVFVSVDQHLGAVTVGERHERARKNTLDLFPELIGKRCAAVVKVEGDRMVSFVFEHQILNVLLFSANKGNVVLTENGAITDSFKNKKQLLGTSLQPQHFDIQPTGIYRLLGFDRDEFIEKARSTTTFFVLENNSEVKFSLLPVPGWKTLYEDKSVSAAIRKTISIRDTINRAADKKARAMNIVEQKLKKLTEAIERLERVGDTNKNEHLHTLAGILQSLPYQSESGRDSVDAVDYSGNPVTIKLDASLTIAENVALFYKKAKNANKAVDDRKRRLPELQQQHQKFSQLLENIQHDDEESITSVLKNAKSKSVTALSEYREFDLGSGYRLYVGRNAKNNDELTMRFAKPNDWWLHARGVSGSHCVIRNATSSQPPPKHILELAASVAAYYSTARNATFTPVVVTQKKFVRKPKGAAVGAVVVSREEVLMVEPRLPE